MVGRMRGLQRPRSGSCSPGGLECWKEGKPSWVAYGEGRGGHRSIDTHHEGSIFMFREPEGLFTR